MNNFDFSLFKLPIDSNAAKSIPSSSHAPAPAPTADPSTISDKDRTKADFFDGSGIPHTPREDWLRANGLADCEQELASIGHLSHYSQCIVTLLQINAHMWKDKKLPSLKRMMLVLAVRCYGKTRMALKNAQSMT